MLEMKDQALDVGDVAGHLLDGVPLCGAKESSLLTCMLLHSFYIQSILILTSSLPCTTEITCKPPGTFSWSFSVSNSHYALLVYCVSPLLVFESYVIII